MFFSNVGVADVFRAYYKILKLSTGFSGTSTSQFRRRLQRIYSNVVFGISFVYLGFHALNTAIRATRYTPEFAQCLFEDLGLNGIQIVAILLRSTEQKFLYLIEFMEKEINKVDRKEVKRVQNKVKIILLAYLLCCFSMVSTVLLQAYVPLSEEEYKIRRLVYDDTRYPERTLPSMVKIPGIDETVSWNYEVLLCLQLYLACQCFIQLIIIVTLLPLSVAHLQGK